MGFEEAWWVARNHQQTCECPESWHVQAQAFKAIQEEGVALRRMSLEKFCLPKFKVVDAASAFLTRPLYQIACPWLLWVLQGPHCRAGLVGGGGQALPGCF